MVSHSDVTESLSFAISTMSDVQIFYIVPVSTFVFEFISVFIIPYIFIPGNLSPEENPDSKPVVGLEQGSEVPLHLGNKEYLQQD